MRAVQLIETGKPLRGRAVDDPSPGAQEVLVDIRAAGICRSDAHYRAGHSQLGALPQTLGHEIAGVIAGTGERVAIHYLLESGAMIGKEVDGGYAEKIVVPARNCVPIPDNVSFEAAAVMMCSTATAYHALRLAATRSGEKVAIVGLGGVGYSALLLTELLGARAIAVDRIAAKRALAGRLGAEAVDDVRQVKDADVILDLVGEPAVRSASLRALARSGRLVLVALDARPFEFNPYRDVLARETHIIGSSDHTLEELGELMSFAAQGKLDVSSVITRRVSLDAQPINDALDELERGTSELRTVIVR